MFCIKCGAKNPDGSKFCSSCGSSMVEIQKKDLTVEENPSPLQSNQSTNADSSPQPVVSNVPHPPVPAAPQAPVISNVAVSDNENPMKIRCPRCKSEIITTMTKTSTTTKTSGYKGGLGCLGWLMLGPLGLLCGLCGMGTKTKIKHSSCLVCQECGNEFLFLNDKLRELKVGAMQSFAVGVILVLLCFFIFNDSVLYILLSLAIGILLIIAGVFEVKEYKEVKLKGYEASCYKKEKENK